MQRLRDLEGSANSEPGAPIETEPADVGCTEADTRPEPFVRTSPEIALNNVVLPAPLGPTRPRISRSAMLKVTFLRAVRPPKRTVAFSTLSMPAGRVEG